MFEVHVRRSLQGSAHGCFDPIVVVAEGAPAKSGQQNVFGPPRCASSIGAQSVASYADSNTSDAKDLPWDARHVAEGHGEG